MGTVRRAEHSCGFGQRPNQPPQPLSKACYFPADRSYEESATMLSEEPERFKKEVQATLRRHASAINTMAERGMYFWDYGNAFLLEASRVGAEVVNEDGSFAYPSYVEDIMGPMCFDYGFGPYRWVCTSGDPATSPKQMKLRQMCCVRC